MIPQDGITLQYLKTALRRRLWYAVVPFFVLAMASVVYCIKAPKVYQSSTLILVQPQEVPAEYVQPTVTTNATSRLNTLKEQVMSRPRLEEIIKKYDLYPEVRASRTMQDAVELMREHITVEVNESRDRRDTSPASFRVSYDGAEGPAKVRDVTAAVTNLFIIDNLKLREAQATGTSRFLERELQRMKEVLRHKEEEVRKFKEEHLGVLPEQMENNYRILEQRQLHLNSLNATLQQTRDRKVLLQTQLQRLQTVQATSPLAPGPVTGSSNVEAQLNLEQLRQLLASQRTRYSEQHPDVLRTKAMIAKREKEEETESPETPDSQGLGLASSQSEAQRLMVLQREDAITQLKLIETEIWTLSREIKKTEQQIEAYRQRIEGGPKIEQLFVDLRRDYDEASENYQSLLEKKMQADLAENLERTQKGEQFTVLEPADLPEKPIKPKIPKILLLGFMMAAAAGLGLAFMREHLDPTFWSARDLEDVLEIPVLVSIPVITTTEERRWNLLKKAATVCGLIVMSSALLAALFVLWRNNPTLLPL